MENIEYGLGATPDVPPKEKTKPVWMSVHVKQREILILNDAKR